MDRSENELRIAKAIGDELFSFPYESISRLGNGLFFIWLGLETNQNSTILLDEPCRTLFRFILPISPNGLRLTVLISFPTHNPYVLSSIVGKTPVNDLAVFIATMEDFCTKLKPASVEGLSRILDYGPDAFLNLDKLVEA